MGQVQHIEASETVKEILGAECNALAVAKAKRFVESFMFTTTALIALEAAIREQYGDMAEQDIATVDGAPLADLIGSIVRPAAELEAVEL